VSALTTDRRITRILVTVRWVSRLAIAVVAMTGASLVACTSDDPAPEAADPGVPGEPSYTSASPAATEDSSVHGVVPADRRTTWNPGVTYGGGGIPDRATTCATLSPSGGDDTAAIAAALESCPDDQVVQLTTGTFNVTEFGVEIRRSNVTLRGAGTGEPGSGAGGTRMVKADRDADPSNAVLYIGNGPYNFASSTDLATDAVKGTHTLTLVDNPGLQVGEYVLIDHVTNDDPTVAWGDEHEGPGGGSRRWFDRQDRSLTQILEVTATDGNEVTFDTPFHWTFRTAYQAQLSRYGEHPDGPVLPFVEWVGVEDIYFEGGAGGDFHGNVAITTCAYCWVRNIESNLSIGTAVGLYATYRSEIRDSYIHSSDDPNPGGAGYLTGINFGAADNLIENNVIWSGNKMIVMRASGGGNVVAYNYMQDGYGAGYKDIPEVGLNAAHYTTPHMELLEGNHSFNAVGESFWGNSTYITMFRNHLTGTRRNAGGLGLSDVTLRKVVVLDRYSYYFNMVANILGEEAMTLQGDQERFVYEATAEELETPVVPMWLIGHNGENLDVPFDPMVAETTVRHGNYDFVTNDVVWDDNLPVDLPPSLYLTDKPEFFGDHPWPWVRPEDGGATDVLPAQERFDRIHGS